MKKLVLSIAAVAVAGFCAGAALPVATGTDREYRLPDDSAKVFVWNTTNELGSIEFFEDTVADVLVVGGGGSGGPSCGGGGGGGGVVYSQQVTIPAGTYTVTVGAGGPEAGTSAAASKPATVCGGDSLLSGSGLTLMAKGGGWGAAGVSAKTAPTSGYLAAAGGSGGGGANYQTEGAGIEGQGFAGGAPAGSFGAGSGGGGATAVGEVGVVGAIKDLTVPSIGGNGGSGVMCTITGEEVYYGGGGGAGVYTFDWYSSTKNWQVGLPGLGGNGGGGNGGGGNLTSGLQIAYQERSNLMADPQPGQDGHGGGGGGGGYVAYPNGVSGNICQNGAPGGCGTVIVRVAVDAGITVNLNGTVLSGDAPATVTLTAQVSTDKPDETVEYQWDFESDGTFDETTTDSTTTHVYMTSGDHTATVKVVELTGDRREATATYSFSLGPIYVDANAPAGGDGYSWETALQTIPEGIDRANDCSVLVKGGLDRVYTVNSEATALVIPEDKANLTIKAVDGHATINVPIGTEIQTGLIPYLTIGARANGVTISGLDFIVNVTGDNVEPSGSSIGDGGTIISVLGDDATIDDCSISVRGGYPKRGWYGIFCPGESSGASTGDGLGLRLKVRNCTFSGFNCHPNFGAIPVVSAYDPQIVGNTFTNCMYFYRTAKSTDAFLFVSNVIVECSHGLDSCATYDASARTAEIAYNILKASKPGIAFFKKEFRGMSAARIHHNTAIGCEALIDLGPSKWNGGALWTASVFDNVLVSEAEDAALVKETWTFTQAGYTTMFLDGSFVRNNAFYCPNGGLTNVSAVANHDFAGKVAFLDNIELDAAPVFISEKPGDPDFCRPKQSRNPAWVGKGKAWTDGGVYPDYIGAVEPVLASGLMLIVR